MIQFNGRLVQFSIISCVYFVIFCASSTRANTSEEFSESVLEVSAVSTLNGLEYEIPLNDVIRAKRQGVRTCRSELFSSASEDPYTRHYRAIEFEPIRFDDQNDLNSYVSRSHNGRDYYYARKDGDAQIQQSSLQPQPEQHPPVETQSVNPPQGYGPPPNPVPSWQPPQFNPYWYQVAQQNYQPSLQGPNQPIKPFQGPVSFPQGPSSPTGGSNIQQNNPPWQGAHQYAPNWQNGFGQYASPSPWPQLFRPVQYQGSEQLSSQSGQVSSKPPVPQPPSAGVSGQGYSHSKPIFEEHQGPFQPFGPVPSTQAGPTYPVSSPPLIPQPIPQNGFLHFRPFSPWSYGSQKVHPLPQQQAAYELRPTLICQYVLQPTLPLPGYMSSPSGPGSPQDPKPKPDGPKGPQDTKPTPLVQGQQQISKPLVQDDFEDYASKLRPLMRGGPYQIAPSSTFQPLNPVSPWSKGDNQFGRLFESGQEFYGVPVWLYLPVEQNRYLKPATASSGYQNQQSSVGQKLILSDGPVSELKDQVVAVHGFQSPSAVKGTWYAPPSVQETRQASEPYSIYAENEDWGFREASSRCAGGDAYDPAILVNKNLQDKLGDLMERVIANQI